MFKIKVKNINKTLYLVSCTHGFVWHTSERVGKFHLIFI